MVKSSKTSKSVKLGYISVVLATVSMTIFAIALVVSLFGSDSETPAISSADITPPVISGVHDISIYVGEAPAYRKGVTVSDDSGDENVTLNIDSSEVDLNRTGQYVVIYTATDKSGNTATAYARLTVDVYFPATDELNQKLDKVISQIITENMNTEQKIRAIYKYVQGNIAFVNSSEKSSWRAEAYNALFVKGSGDCFSFFAASKAFFERLGIQSMDIQRPDDIAKAMNQTHYWSLVNISDDSEKQIWYHYDSCRLRAEYNHSGCLLTETQIKAYDYVRDNFYAYESSNYPNVCDVIITPTPELEPFYNKD